MFLFALGFFQGILIQAKLAGHVAQAWFVVVLPTLSVVLLASGWNALLKYAQDDK